jgi:hypothetical protein
LPGRTKNYRAIDAARSPVALENWTRSKTFGQSRLRKFTSRKSPELADFCLIEGETGLKN